MNKAIIYFSLNSKTVTHQYLEFIINKFNVDLDALEIIFLDSAEVINLQYFSPNKDLSHYKKFTQGTIEVLMAKINKRIVGINNFKVVYTLQSDLLKKPEVQHFVDKLLITLKKHSSLNHYLKSISYSHLYHKLKDIGVQNQRDKSLDDLIKYLVYEYSLKYYYFEKVNYSIEFVEHIEQEINLKLNNFLNESSPLFFEKQQIVKVDKKFFTLSLNKIDFSYPNSKFNLKIDNFDFEPGITYGIYGTNSSGKSTLFNIIGGHLNANKGEVLYHKINIDKIRKNDRYISTVFQELALFKHLSVRKNILMGLHSYKKMTSIDSMSALAEELERAFLIYEYRKMKPSKLSGGNKQKTSICRSLIMKPDILLLDEPTSSIDQDSILVVNNTIKKFRTNWNIVIVISHDSDFLKDTCDEIIDMKHGKLILRK